MTKKQQADNASKHVILLVLHILQFTVQNLCQTTPAFNEKPGREYHAEKLCPKHGCQTSTHASFQTQHYVWGTYLIFTLQMVTFQNVYSLGVGVENSKSKCMYVRVTVYSLLVTLSGHFNDKYFMEPDTLYVYTVCK